MTHIGNAYGRDILMTAFLGYDQIILEDIKALGR